MNANRKSSAAASGYDPGRSRLLARCCAWVYQLQDLNRPPPEGYQWVEVLWFREPWLIVILKKLLLWLAGHGNLLNRFATLQAWDWEFKTPFGAVLESEQDIIVAFRGTQDASDVITDLTIRQRGLPRAWNAAEQGFGQVRVHAGFCSRTEKLRKQLQAAVEPLDRTRPVYVTGHSLGGAVAILAAVVLKHRCGFGDVRLYTYAGPRVGDPAFAAAYDQSLPKSYRVVNDADLVPQVPLKRMRFWKFLHADYAHVGEKWSFLNQTDDLFSNHGIDKPRNYLAAAEAFIPSDVPWNFPVSSQHPGGASGGGSGGQTPPAPRPRPTARKKKRPARAAKAKRRKK